MARFDKPERSTVLNRSWKPGETSVYEDVAKDPTRTVNFGLAMQFFSSGEGYEVTSLVEGYPWVELGKGTVVDVSSFLAHENFQIKTKILGWRSERIRQCRNFKSVSKSEIRCTEYSHD
jgi:hypothetical protein